MRSNYKKLGQYIQPVNIRNKDLKVKNLLGVSIKKVLMPSIANTVGTNMKTYKIIKKHQFAYGPVTSRNGDKISIALLEDFDEAIISQAYVVFEILDTKLLNPEYLMMWFRRPEFDRYARFKSHGSARETFDWDELCDTELPIPSIEKQNEIVKEYNTVVNRIKLNEQLNQKLEETAQALYKHWFVDFNFPSAEGKPYKSSGGAMVYNEELDKEIPVGWEVKRLNSIYKFQYGKGNNNPDNSGIYPVYGSNGVIGGYDLYNSEDSPVIGHIGINAGIVVFAFGKHFVTYNGVICNLISQKEKWFSYLTLKSIDLMSQTRGSSQPFVSYDMLYDNLFCYPNHNLIEKFEHYCFLLFQRIEGNIELKDKLIKLEGVILSKMTKIKVKD
jgi:type I restriction enzyme S subunit